jgi:DNA polymerase-3 subunit gamma/tau
LKAMADEEKIQVDSDALSLVARQATGSMRDAISLLDQLASAGDKITLQLAQDILGTATSQAVIDLIEAMIKDQSNQGLEIIHRALDSGSDPRQFARQIVEYLRGLLLVAMGNASQVDATPESRNHLTRPPRKHAATGSLPCRSRWLLLKQ